MRAEELLPLLLAIDVGNTNIVIGVFQGEEIVADWRIATDGHTMPDEYAVLFRGLMGYHGLTMQDIHDAIIASVVPKVTSNLR